MKDVLIVEDDKLVRMGLTTSVPWERFGMRIAGEAKNGVKALEFLASREVDLIITDLAMPVMSGIELMRSVRERYPDIMFVVLTMHQDFEYIQESLRLGAIDYIAKVELEQDNFDTILTRIQARMAERRGGHSFDRSTDVEPERTRTDEGYALFLPDRPDGPGGSGGLSGSGGLGGLGGPARGPDGNASASAVAATIGMNEIEPGLWLCLPDAEDAGRQAERLKSEAAAHPGLLLLELRGLLGMETEDLKRRLRTYIKKGLFYDVVPGRPTIRVRLDDSSAPPEAGLDDRVARIRNKWSSPDWLYSPPLFRQLLLELNGLKLPQPQLLGLLYSLADEWNRLYASVSSEAFPLPARLDYWHEAEEWLAQTRERIERLNGKQPYSQEVVGSVMKAAAIVQEELAEPITAGDTARRVNMSRGYFSQCFKDITGHTFNDYLRRARLEKAKELLLYSSRTVAWIAENTGYQDEKYFSRLFREQIGMLPSEFRAAGRR